ncbi:MAG: tRNA pseudouridine(55) synthase TruB [Candidatus Nanopelagicales bacterium]
MKSGFAFIDKPSGLTSHDVVNQARRLTGTKKVGHAGTLDPFATGLLILGINKATRLLGFLLNLDKSYRATMRLGEATNTDDLTGEIVEQNPIALLDEENIRSALLGHVGVRMQTPSSFSAKKVGGVKAYERARNGEDVVLQPKEISIYSIENIVIHFSSSTIDVDFDVRCSSGTYVRAIARDIGNELGVGGHLISLRRTLIGEFSVDNASTVESLKIVPIKEVCRLIMNLHTIQKPLYEDVKHGKPLSFECPEGLSALLFDEEVVAVIENTQGIITYKVVLIEQ